MYELQMEKNKSIFPSHTFLFAEPPLLSYSQLSKDKLTGTCPLESRRNSSQNGMKMGKKATQEVYLETGEESEPAEQLGQGNVLSYIIVQLNDLDGSILFNKCLLNIYMNSEHGFLGYIFCFVQTFRRVLLTKSSSKEKGHDKGKAKHSNQFMI